MILLHLADGPAAGEYATDRAPIYLRGVVSPHGNCDVLDQADDAPRPREKVNVYRRTKVDPQQVIFCMRGREGCLVTTFADYEHLSDVDGQKLRDNDAWLSWCRAQFNPILASFEPASASL